MISRFGKLVFSSMLLACCLLTSSCVKEFQEDMDKISGINGVQSDVGMTLPLLDATVGLADFYEDFSNSAYIRLEPDQSITFAYAQSVKLPNKQYVEIPTVPVNFTLKVDAAAAAAFNTVGGFSHSISSIQPVPSAQGEKLKQLFIKRGRFNFNITTNIKHSIKIVFYYPTITKDGIPLQDTLNIVYAGIDPVVLTKETNLDGYTIDFTDNGISYNVMPYLIGLDIQKINGNPAVQIGDTLSLAQAFTIDEYRGINGYIGKRLLQTFDENIALGDLQQIDVKLKLKDPRLRFSIACGLGIPITAKIDTIAMVNSDGNYFPVQIDLFRDTFTIPAPTTVGQFATREYVIDRNNSNIDDLINNSLNNAPDSIKLKFSLWANYRDIEVDNFLFDTSSLNTDFAMEIPLDLQVERFETYDTSNLKLPNSDIDIKEIAFRSLANNTIPLNAKVQLYFAKSRLDSPDLCIAVDSLYDNGGFTLTKAVVDASGEIIPGPDVLSEAIMDRAKYLRLRDVQKVDRQILRISVETARDAGGAQQFVKIKKNQTVSLKMGVNAKAKIKQKF